MNNTAAKNLVSPLTYINISRSTMVVLLTTLFIAEGKRKKEESRSKKKEEKCSSNIFSFPQFDALSANHLVDCYLTKLR